jgi:hypothetical protein
MWRCVPRELDGAEEFQRQTFATWIGEPYHSRRRHDQTKPSLVALVRPLSRPFL